MLAVSGPRLLSGQRGVFFLSSGCCRCRTTSNNKRVHGEHPFLHDARSVILRPIFLRFLTQFEPRGPLWTRVRFPNPNYFVGSRFDKKHHSRSKPPPPRVGVVSAVINKEGARIHNYVCCITYATIPRRCVNTCGTFFTCVCMKQQLDSSIYCRQEKVQFGCASGREKAQSSVCTCLQ